MTITYPDIAFCTATQIVLFFVNCTVTTASYYWGVNIVLQIHQNPIGFKRKFLFSLLSAMLLNILVIYGIALINGIVKQMHQLYIGAFLHVTVIMLPFSYFVLYLLGIKVLKLSHYKSIKVMQLSYMYYVCCNIVLKIAGTTLFPSIADARGWNYLRDIFMLISRTIIIYLVCRLIRYTVDRYKLYLNLVEDTGTKSLHRELIKNFCICSAIYTFITVVYSFFAINGLLAILMFGICICYLIISIAGDYIKISCMQQANKEEYITALNQSIEGFRGIKHDFDNILQTYTGYLAIKDIERLTDYHQRVTNTTIFVGCHLDLSQRLPENPSFFSLIINKLERAKENQVSIQLALSCNMRDVYMDILEFNRIIAILLDNAIEGAALTSSKQMSLSSRMKPDGGKLFIVSNDTLDDVKVDDLFTLGYTTKAGHMGQGLPQVRKVLYRYGNSTINLSCCKGSFTVCFELKPNFFSKAAELKTTVSI